MYFMISVKNYIHLSIIFCLIPFSSYLKNISAETQDDIPNYHSAIFSGGPIYTGGPPVMDILRESGFTTLIIWSIHIQENGTLFLNDDKIIENGIYVGNSSWSSSLATLKETPTTIKRIECSIGAWGCRDFENIQALVENQGIGSESILYRNFQVLKNITGADAINYDDESNYHVNSTVEFSFMLINLGFRITLCPYTSPYFWQDVFNEVNENYPTMVDRVYLQCYAGGSGNDPAKWNQYFENITVTPGVWCQHGSSCSQGYKPAYVTQRMTRWKDSANITGGFLWLFDDMLACTEYTPAQYANSINSVFISQTDENSEDNDTNLWANDEIFIFMILVAGIAVIGITYIVIKKLHSYS